MARSIKPLACSGKPLVFENDKSLVKKSLIFNIKPLIFDKEEIVGTQTIGNYE